MPVQRSTPRSRAQKARILDAAQACFVRSGFHAASMATIAKTAGMSPGLIYRYFENKSAIILAIIEQQLKAARGTIRQLRASENLSECIVDYFDGHQAGDADSMSTVLYLEMSAEATRDPHIAEALRRFDITVCSELADWLSRSRQQGGYGLPADVAPARALMLLCLIEGLKVRGAREPTPDRRLLDKALDDIVASLTAVPN